MTHTGALYDRIYGMISHDFEPVPGHDGMFMKRHAFGKKQMFIIDADGTLHPTEQRLRNAEAENPQSREILIYGLQSARRSARSHSR